MKWWWSSNSATADLSTTDSSTTPATAQSVQRKDGAQASQQSVEEELSQFIPGFAQSDNSDTTARDRRRQQENESAFASTVYPTTMSCREAFDAAMHCRGPGGQFLHLYRYGEFRQCTEQWSQFWFCMRTRTKPKAIKEELIREFYREKEEARYDGRPNSEDIWEERTERLTKTFETDMAQVLQKGVIMQDSRTWRREKEEGKVE